MIDNHTKPTWFPTLLDLSRGDIRNSGYDETEVPDDEIGIIAEQMGDVDFLCEAWHHAVRLLCDEHNIPKLRKEVP